MSTKVFETQRKKLYKTSYTTESGFENFNEKKKHLEKHYIFGVENKKKFAFLFSGDFEFSDRKR